MTDIHGFCHDQFSAVREAFQKNFEERDEVGASVAVTFEGEYVVDLWAGHRDAARSEPWEEDTIVNVYSTTKTMAALCALFLADHGEIDLGARVGTYWPEFGQNGKGEVRVGQCLSHTAGVPGFEEPLPAEALYDWGRIVQALERQEPWWEPGAKSGYHAITQGYLIGEIVRRVTGQSLGAFFAQEIAEPLGADFHIGTGPEHFARIGELIPPETSPLAQVKQDTIASRVFANPPLTATQSATSEWRQAEMPAVNGHGNARSVVRAQTLIANRGQAFGVQLMSEAGTRRVFEEQSLGVDLVLETPLRFGVGYALTSEALPVGPNQHSAYWGGWGGSTVVVDWDARLCISYVMNRMEGSLLGDPRGASLTLATFASLKS